MLRYLIALGLLIAMAAPAQAGAPVSAPTNITITRIDCNHVRLTWTQTSTDNYLYLWRYPAPGAEGQEVVYQLENDDPIAPPNSFAVVDARATASGRYVLQEFYYQPNEAPMLTNYDLGPVPPGCAVVAFFPAVVYSWPIAIQ